MSDKLIDIFAECMEAIETGQLTINECLAQYPQYQVELRDLLQVATEMQAMSPERPSQAMRQQGQANLLANLPARSDKPVRTPIEQEPIGGLAALLLPLAAWMRQIPSGLAQKLPAFTQPAVGIGFSVLSAFVLLLSVGMMTAVGASVLSGIQERSAAARTVSVETTQGLVEVLGTDGKWRPLSKEATVTTNFRVRTGDNSAAKIIFSDGRVASLGPNSEVFLDQLQIEAAQGGTVTVTVTITPTGTFTPTPTMTATETMTPTPTMTATATTGSMVTICHKPGTPAEQTKTIPVSALTGHLGHGDTLGACSMPTPTITATVTISPTITITPTVTITPTETITPTGTAEAFVTICHKPGTPAEQTKTIPESALNGHLGHGDTMGPCPEDTPVPPPAPGSTPTPPPSSGGTVTICHKPGTPAEKTMVVNESGLSGHLGHGDTIGACN